ncbi:haloacid dehalogenase-like hydrolase [Patulibacter sp. NPDC049589]|uniref:HAD family hydrolase n=1 Tax=Patulibacter sp. NPDC049589 TaxID=3154731 RepID=UPI003414D793
MLHVFDMDGTLLTGAATVELARHFDKLAMGEDVETRFLAGTVTDTEFWQTLLDICGEATEADLDAAFHGARWMEGVAAVFADIRARGETAIVISQSPTFFVDRLRAWGAHETYGSAVEIGVPVLDDATLSAEMKVTITEEALSRLGLAPEECVAYGDSGSDIGLFRWLPHTVAVNAAPAIRALAAAHYSGSDLREAYALGRELATA